MSLVADYGSDSDKEESVDENQFNGEKTLDLPDKFIQKSCTTSYKPCAVKEEVNIRNSETDLFSQLPERKLLHLKNGEDQIEDFIPTVGSIKDKQKVKIAIPSLSDFKNDDIYESDKKKIKLAKNCGLLSLLPPVKGSVKTAKSFVPNIVANKNKIPLKSHLQKISNSARQEKIAKKNTMLFKKDSTLSEEEDIDLPETFDEEMWLKICGKPKREKTIIEPEYSTQKPVDIAPEPEKPYDGLSNEAFKELVGKTKRPLGNITLIDVNEEEILPDKDISMIKSLTDPEIARKATCEDPVDPTRKKKHHITYLAQQAKANEQELANAWAASKNSRLASRAKYGF